MKLIVICGATATGKSDLAVSVAQRIDAEIINSDFADDYHKCKARYVMAG
jgi:tRNA dimethylallyltransferase